MTPIDFSRLQNALHAELSLLFAVKSGEYAADADKLANFRGAANRLGMLPEQVLLTYLDKHYAALCNYIRDLATNRVRPRSEPIRGRVMDIMVYCTLFLAMEQERSALSAAVEDSDRTRNRLNWEEDDDETDTETSTGSF